MEYPLGKYKSFIEKVIKSPLFDKHRLALRRIESTVIARSTSLSLSVNSARKQSPSNVVAKIVKSSKGLSIRYTYEGFNRVYQFDSKILSTFLHKLRRISSRNELTHKILKGVIEHQSKYLKTGDPIDLVPLSQVQLPIDNSWTSRLVNRLSIVTPSGEEKPLRWFFQTQKDINKRLIKQLLDKESENLQSGKLKRPYTDNELKTLLEALLRRRNTHHARRMTNRPLSRWSIGHCRKDMGIPSAKRRLSGYKYPPLSANFSMLYPLALDTVLKHAPQKSGIYELSTKDNLRFTNHERQTTVFYIGSTKSLRKRLREHLGKNSKNGRIRDFLKKDGCSFRYILIKKNWQEEEKKLYRLFMDTYGCAPKCNRVRP